MEESFIHLIYTPFTGRGLSNGFRGQEWYEHRIGVFKNYTLKSLLNQTNRNFIHWISFRPEEENNPQTKELEAYLKNLNYNFIFTFDGVMHWDDKVPDDKLLPRLEKTLPKLKELVGDKKYVYNTDLDSDDMLGREVVQEIQKQDFEYHRAVIHSFGYIFNQQTGQLATWNSPNPAMYTLMFPADMFLDPKKHTEYLEIYRGRNHFDIPNIFKCVSISSPYCAVVHGKNISTTWGHQFKGEQIYYESEKRELLKEFGVNYD